MEVVCEIVKEVNSVLMVEVLIMSTSIAGALQGQEIRSPHSGMFDFIISRKDPKEPKARGWRDSPVVKSTDCA